jgi:hypothetical protein
VDHDLFERLQSHLAWPALLPFPHFDAERIFVRVEAGTPLVEAVFPSALVVASRACVSPLPVCDTLSRFGTFALVPARSSLDRGTVVVGERCPCGFRTLNRFAEQLARRSPFAGDVDFVLRPEWRYVAVGHVMRLARDTHLAVLSERDERTAGAHPDSGPCVRETLRTVAHARVIHQGRLFARRTATRMSMDDARPGRGVDEPGVTPRHAPQSASTIGGAHGI